MSKRTYTSKTLRIISYCWISLPATYLIIACLLFSISPASALKLALSPWYWFVSFTAIIAAFGMLKIRWYGWYLFLFSNFTLLYQTALTLVHYSDKNWKYKLITFILSSLIQAFIIFIITKHVRVPYFFPKIRWWENDPRYKLSVQTKIIRNKQNIQSYQNNSEHLNAELDGEIMDISIGGCFIKTHSYFIPDEVLTLSFQIFENKILCEGRIVWRTESTVTHPKGIGVKFESLSKENLLALKNSTRKLRKLARVYNQLNREKNWKDYLEREQKFQGTIPKQIQTKKKSNQKN